MMAGLIFVGGPGRSGTSFVADRIGRHDEVATYQDVELKLFCEYSGLLDLQKVLVDSFSPNRAETVLRQFQNMLKALREGGYGQPALDTLVPGEDLDLIVSGLLERLQPQGYLSPLDYPTFNAAARDFLQSLAKIALDQKPGTKHFLEKTPHNCLQPRFLHELAPTARYLHIYRNPKAVAMSLLRQSWGPSRLDHAIVWVRSYFEAWQDAKAYFERFDLRLADLSIENIARDPKNMSREVCYHLGVELDSSLFDGASLEQLEGWKKGLTSDTSKELDDELGSLCDALGYE